MLIAPTLRVENDRLPIEIFVSQRGLCPKMEPLDAASSAMTEAELRRYIRRKDFAYTPEFLIEVLRAPRNKGEIYWAMVAIGDLNDEAVVPVLKTYLTYANVDIRIVAMTQIGKLAGRKETALYQDALEGTWYREKWAALYCLAQSPDPAAFPSLAGWLKKNRRNLAKGTMHFQNAQEAAEYLFRVKDEVPEAGALLDEIARDVLDTFKAAGQPSPRAYPESLNYMLRVTGRDDGSWPSPPGL